VKGRTAEEEREVDIKIFTFWDREKENGDWKVLLGLLVFAFLLRLPLLFFPEVIHNDGTEYIRHAKLVLIGNWSGGKAPPFYPALIAFTHLFIPDAERGGILISIIFGTLIVLPVFCLGRSIFGEKVGILSALFAAVHPFLYMSSGSVLTESTYHFFLATSVLFGWKAFSEGRFYTILLFSLFTALAYLTKPEGMGFLIIFGVWVLFVNPSNERRRWIHRAGFILLVVLGFLLFSSPYLAQIRKESGRWGISRKVGISIGSLSEEEGPPSIESMKRKKELSLLSFVRNPLPVMGKIGGGFFESLYKFQQVYNPMLFLFALLGWIFILKKRGSYSLKGNFYLLGYLIFFFGFVFPFFWVTRRYTSQMISISIPWAAFGFLGVMEWVDKRSAGKQRQVHLSSVLLILLLAVLFLQGRVIHPREHRLIQREAGLWMKDCLPRGIKVMSTMPQEAFYAGLEWIRMPQGSYEEILNSAHANGVRYLLIDEEIEKISPGFLEKLRGDDLILIKDMKKKDRRIEIFEIVSEGK
jgi:4-amino-4-deoxy-L-arabinose transferase-like glycosyltransferase